MRLAAPETQATFYYAMDDMSQRVVPHFAPHFVPSAMPAGGNPLPILLMIVWACGVVVVTANWWLRWYRVRSVGRAAAPLRTADGIPVLCSREGSLEPGVFGLLRPVILVPEGITEHLSPEQFEAVLTHEVCHVRRRDNLAAAVHMLVEALFWFNPLVWWVGRQLTLERERICDDEVLQRSNDPAVYAEGILNVCRFYVESPLRCVAGVTGSNLKQRIEEIMGHRSAGKLGLAKKLLLTATLAGAVAGPVWIGLSPRAPASARRLQRKPAIRGRLDQTQQFGREQPTAFASSQGAEWWHQTPPSGR